MPIQRPAPLGDGSTIVRVALAIGVLGVLWTAVPKLEAWQRRNFADRMARIAETAEPEAARLAVRRLADSGPDALDALVRLAGSANADAADAAQRAVSNQLAAWVMAVQSSRDEREFAKRLQALAEALVDATDAHSPEGQRWARRIALRVVDQCGRLTADHALGVLADCDRVLSAPLPAVAAAPLPPRSAAAAAQAPAESPAALRVAAVPLSPQASPPAAGATADPEADLRLIAPPAETPSEALPGNESPPATEWQPSPGGATIAPVTPRVADDDPRVRPLPAPSPSESVVDVPSPLEARRLLRRYRQLSDRQLATELAGAAHYDALAIRQVLRERSLPSVAAPRSSPSNPTRSDAESQLFDRVSELPPADARQLLRELAADATETPEMRLQALTLLATTGDPQLAEIARSRAIEDSDPRVAELASRILDDQQR